MKFSSAFLFLLSATLFVAASTASKEVDADVKWANYKVTSSCYRISLIFINNNRYLFQLKHKKNFSPKEEAARKANFLKVDKEIELHNGNPDSTYTKAHNHMSDWVLTFIHMQHFIA